MSEGKRSAHALRKFSYIFIGIFIIGHAAKMGMAQDHPSAVSGPQPHVPQINADFTLKYHVIQTENESPAALEEIYRTNAVGIDRAVTEGRMNRQQADQSKADIRKALKRPNPPNNFSIVLSSRDGKLLFRVSGTREEVFIWDGKDSYSYNKKEKLLTVEHGFYYKPLIQIPLPGAGIPGIEMIKLASSGSDAQRLRGEVYTQYVGQTGPLFRPGVLIFEKAQDEKLWPSVVEWRERGELDGKCEFFGNTVLNNIHIARVIRRSEYNGMIPHSPGTDPVIASTTYYSLVSSSAEALPEKEFLAISYLQAPVHENSNNPGSRVTWNDPGHKLEFSYTAKETLQEQHDKQLQFAIANLASEKTRSAGRHGVAGPILILLLVASGVWWLLRRRGTTA